jgi:hypothetical protein
MQMELAKIYSKECLSTVTSLQVSQAELPNKYEEALTATNVAIQQNITVKSAQANAVIDMNTQVSQARISAPVVINEAEARVNATLQTNLAAMQSYLQVTKTEGSSYEMMKTALQFGSDENLLNYIKVKAINSFNPKNLIVGVAAGTKG